MPMNMEFLLEDQAHRAPLGELWRRLLHATTALRRNGAARREAERGWRERCCGKMPA
jgi:hypothetical protein